ncbi:MAG: PP2C family protein-serine/threonine phosphatase [Pseudomonadota bacterium]
MKIKMAFTQHAGNNPDQQDALWDGKTIFQKRDLPVSSRLVETNKRMVVALSDGVACSSMPQRASRVALETLAIEMAAGAMFNVSTIRRVHGRLCDVLAKGKTFGSSTTLVAMECVNDRWSVLSVGDSRAYRIPATGEWQQLTRDHTILNAMIDNGVADAATEYASFYGMLDMCLVADDEETEFQVHRATAQLNPGDAILLCTDGVHDTLGDDKLKKLITYPIDPIVQIEAWRKAILKAGAPDNFSMLLVQYL